MIGRRGLIRVVVVLVALGTMGPLCGHDFLLTWDDAPTIARNEHFNPPTLKGIEYYWRHPNMGLYVPVTYTVWGGLAYVAKLDQPDETGVSLNPWVYHAANVVVHVINSLLVLEILGALMDAGWAAGVGAMVFAVHPVQVEAVAWAAGMKDLLCGFFSLMAVWQYLKTVRNAECRMQNEGWWGLGVAAGAMVVGQFCKPTAMVVPLVVAAIDHWIVGRPWKKVLVSAGVLLLIAVPGMVVARGVQRATSISIVPVWQRFIVAGDALAFYLWKLVWPVGLALDYGRRPRWVMSQWWGYVTWAAPAVVALVIWLNRRRRRWRWVVAAGLVFVAGVLPVLGISPFLFQHYSTVTDHYLYLSMLGVAMAVAWGAEEASRRWASGPVAMVCAVLVAVLAARSVVEGSYWSNDLTLWRRNVQVNPRSFAAENNLGMALQIAGDLRTNDGRGKEAAELYREAEGHFRRADALLPGFGLAKQNVAMVLAKQGRVDESIAMIEESVRTAEGPDVPPDMRANYDEALVTLGQVQMNRGKFEEAKRYFEEALRRRPGWEAAERGLKDAEAKLRGSATRGAATAQ